MKRALMGEIFQKVAFVANYKQKVAFAFQKVAFVANYKQLQVGHGLFEMIPQHCFPLN